MSKTLKEFNELLQSARVGLAYARQAKERLSTQLESAESPQTVEAVSESIRNVLGDIRRMTASVEAFEALPVKKIAGAR